jgi:amidase
MNVTELCFLTATELQRLLRDREVSARELTEVHLAQIDRVNPRLNAIITLLADQALEQASAADENLLRGHQLGPLHGLPVAHKDMAETKGIRTTFGSPIFRDHVPDQDALIIERLKAAGAITIGKTNTPEFGAGSQTYNEVFGETLNPYDLAKTCGGSSGGAAVALACGMIPIADGGDFGGSLRNPASFCNVVGFRPSPGRVPSWPTEAAWFPLQVQGPMARTVEDIALMLSAIAGPDSRSPIAITEPADLFTQPLERDFRGVQLAWSRDFGQIPVDPLVTEVLEARRPTFESLGCEIIDETPDFSDADEIFKTWRAWQMELNFRDLLETHREAIKETIIWNAQEGKKLTGPQLARVELKRTQLYHRVRRFMERCEFMIFPVSQVPPFAVQDRYVTEINGEKMHTYIDWMKSCYFISVTGLPAISVPCGFTTDGLPVGIQIVGRHHDDFGVLQLAFAFQQATEFWKNRPGITR